MKTKILSILGGLAMSISSFAQSDTISIPDSSSWYHLYSQVIPLSSSGILPQTTFSELPYDRLTGNPAKEYEPVSPELFGQLLLDINQADMGQKYTAYLAAEDNFHLAVQQFQEVPIIVLDMKYDLFRSDDSTLTQWNDQHQWIELNDTNNDSIFYEQNLFVLAVPDSFRFNGLKLVLDSNHYYSNHSMSPTSFLTSIDQGLTWMNKNWGDIIDLNTYSEMDVWIKAIYPDSTQKLGVFKVAEISCGGMSVPTPALAPWDPDPNQFSHGNIIANRSHPGANIAVGNAYTWFRPNPSIGEENLYKKPIIIVEGIDFGSWSQQNALNYQFGDFGWCSLWGSDPSYPLQKMPTLLNSLHQEGYDIIMLDFIDGDAHIQANAYLLAALIEKVKDHKTSDAEPIVVMGASMGGLVARYALRWMELNDMDHCTRLFMTLDSPHRGAYIPLGVQRFVDFYANNDLDQSDGAKAFEKKLMSPAARQLLVLSNSGSPHPWHTDLYNELGQMGYPETTRNVAVSCGSKDGSTLPFSEGAKLFEMSGSTTSVHLGWSMKKFTWCKIWSLANYQQNEVFDGGLGGFKFLGHLIPVWALRSAQYALRMGPSNVPSFDRLAGGKRPTIREVHLSDIPEWVNRSPLHFDQNFIPMVSSLDLQTSNWYYDAMNIDNDYPDASLTPFDAIYAAPRNTFHVEVTEGALVNGTSRGNNAEFMLKQILDGGSTTSSSFASLTNTYNYGANSRDHVVHKRVDNGGALLLYGNQGDADGSLPAPPSGKIHEYFLGQSACASANLTIGDGGTVVVGESSVGNTAIFHIQPGSSLTIESGGSIRIEGESQFVIEDGGELIIHPNANIDLEGLLSKMTIKGKLHILNNATFSFTGKGHIVLNQQLGKFDANGNWFNDYDAYWEFGTDAKIDLSGANNSDLILVVAKNNHIRTSNGTKPAEVKISTGLVQIDRNQQLHIGSDLIMSHVRVECSKSGQTHQGIRHWNTNSKITNCEFSDGNSQGALALNNIGGNKSALVEYSDFTDNVLGLQVTGEGADILDCHFEDNTTGAVLNYVSRSSQIKASDFKNNDLGLRVTGQTGFSLKMLDNLISNNSTYGVELISVESSVFQTNRILSNYIGVRAFGSVVDMSQEAYNCIEDNQVGIQLMAEEGYKGGVYLLNGLNRFDLGTHSNGKYITGAFCPDKPKSIYNGSFIDASNNQIPFIQRPNALPLMPVSIMHKSNCFNGTYTAIPLHFDPGTQLTSITGACGVGGSNQLDDFMYEERELNLLGGGRIIFGGPFASGSPLRDAILSGAQNISRSSEDVRNDALALDYLQAVLSQGVQSWTSEEERMFELAYSLAKRAFANLHQYDENYTGITNPSEDDRLSFLTTYINSELYDLVQAGNAGTYAEFLWNLDYAQLHRAGNYYNEAITHLNTASNWSNGLELDRANFWKCICEAERDLVYGVIDEEDFEIQTENCVALNPNAAFKTSGSSDDMDEYEGYAADLSDGLVTTLYPNPTDGTIQIELSAPVAGKFYIRVSDLTGRTVKELEFFNPPMTLSIDISKLAPGIYVVTYTDEKETRLGASKQVTKY